MSIIDIPPVFKMTKQNKCSAFCHIHILSIIDNFNYQFNTDLFMEEIIMYDWELPVLVILAVLMLPFAVILLAVVLAIFCLIVDTIAFAITDFISRYSNSRSNSKED